ncbi:MAG: hypothetical protein ABIQ59_07950 [Nocardioidaceae bacterium]
MSVRLRLGARVSAALVVLAVPVSMAGLSPLIINTSGTVAVPQTSAAPAPALGRQGERPPAVAEQTTIAGGLQLRTKRERNRKIAVSSSKGSHVWTASSLAEHDLPSAALRAYKDAAASIDRTDPGCHLPWTLLAGIGRVESDHGRYGGSVLGDDGVPRPAIVGVALDGKGPVAAIEDTDHGAFDGDLVWDRAVGPMQFIPSTWLGGAGRDGDGDGTSSPNDIDDAALAAAAYLCNAGGNLAEQTAEDNAVFRYNPSDYYVSLVTAFARGYRTGVFVIPSPDAPDAAEDAAKKASKAKAKAKAKEARAAAKSVRLARTEAKAARTARTAKALARTQAAAAVRANAASARAAQVRAAKLAAAKAAATHKTPTSTPTKSATSSGGGGGGTTSSPSPIPTPAQTPDPPKVLTVNGVVTAAPGGGWQVDGVKLGAGDVGDLAVRDYDGDGTTEPVADELDGLVGSSRTVSISYSQQPGFRVVGLS